MIFDWEGEGQIANHMQWRHQKFSKRVTVLQDKIGIGGMVWHVTRILLKEDLNQKLKLCSKLSKLRDEVSKLVKLIRNTDGDGGLGGALSRRRL